MCGIAGFLSTPSSSSSSALWERARAMADTMRHRGPDDGDAWADGAAGVGLGHRRLSIIDLSPLGRQPMHSECGRYVLAYNGEVYNHPELRRELEVRGRRFRGGSDTETILAGMAEWGVRRTVERMAGMFAFALWDAERREMTLGRDRLGIKPLYWGRAGKDFVFGSELKALRVCPGFRAAVDRDALALFFRHNYIPAPHSVYADAWKLEPGCLLTVRQSGGGPELRTERYWDLRRVWEGGAMNPWDGSYDEAVDALDGLLRTAVKGRMLADVPLGAFLSGGVDSSTVAALMQSQSDRPVRTFSIGFREAEHDESAHARAVAAHLGTEHTELTVTPERMLEMVSDIPQWWDEPFSDSSQVPTWWLSRLTREHVTVSLSGDGGDELFAGYDRYFHALRYWERLSAIPGGFRRAGAGALSLLPGAAWRLAGPAAEKVRMRLNAVGAADFAAFYRGLISHQQRPGRMVPGAGEPETVLARRDDDGFLGGQVRSMQYWDLAAYLPDDILVKVDRGSMAVSLEARVPLLDHRVVEFAARLPESFCVRDGRTKAVLRDVLARYVPESITDRPKMGFAVPLERWLRKDLRDWAETLLDPDSLRGQPWLDAHRVRRMWRENSSGARDWTHQLWDVLMFLAWAEAVRPER